VWGRAGVMGAVVWIEMQNVLGGGVCFLLDYLIVIVDDCFFQMFTNVGNRGNFWKLFYFIPKCFKNQLHNDNVLFVMYVNRKAVLSV
jgi:hypothetical protein